jgi:LPXTG-motif cell wall-anchored protein
LYHDTNYKHIETVKAAAAKKEAVSEPADSEIAAEATKSTEESSLSSYLIGLVVLALAGFYFFKKRSVPVAQQEASAVRPAKASYALTTGVAKYLNKVSGTGVSRYLESHVKSVSATGVAKYMAKQAASSKATSAKAATGVEKYMRDRG